MIPRPDYQFFVELKLNPLDQSSRLGWGGDAADVDRLIARAHVAREAKEIVLLTEYGADGRPVQQWRVELDGNEIKRVPL